MAGLLLGLTLTAYLPAATNGFIWDDDAYVEQNKTLRSPAGLGQIWFQLGATPQYYPLVHTSFWLEYQLWQLNPLGYHIVNILLHIAAALLLWRALIFLRLPGAWFIAALFALHPVHVESVAWITERKNVLSAVLYMGALLFYLRFAMLPGLSRGRALRFYLLALVLFLGALLSKTVTCSLPAVILLLLWWRDGLGKKWAVVGLAPFFATGLGFGLLTAWVEKHHVKADGIEWSLTILERFLIASRALCFYVYKLLWPETLIFTYPRWQIDGADFTWYLFPLLCILALTTVLLLLPRFGKGPLVALLCFAGTLFPALGFIDVYPMRYSFVADHFQYLASIAILALVTSSFLLLTRFWRTLFRWRWAVAATVLLMCGVLSWQQSRIYHSREVLWRDTIAKNPSAWMAYANLGVILKRRGDLAGALKLYSRVLELRPADASALNNIGNIKQLQGQHKQAIEYFQQALLSRPDYPHANNNLGLVYSLLGQWDLAAHHYQLAIDGQPEYGKARRGLAKALFHQGRYEEAQQHLQHLARQHPKDPELQKSLGLVHKRLRRFDQALHHYQRALQLSPGSPDLHNDVGRVLVQLARQQQAQQHFLRAIELDPKMSYAHSNLATQLLLQGKAEQAKKHLKQAIAAKPTFLEAHYQLAQIYQSQGQARPALVHYSKALELKRDWILALEKKAWILASWPDPALRNGAAALPLARRSCELSNNQRSSALDVLAAAQAEQGDYKNAISTAQRALDLHAPGPEQRAQEIKQRLALYQKGQPYRLPVLAGHPPVRAQ